MKKNYETPDYTAVSLSVPDVLRISGEEDFSGTWEEEEP